jgi:hypothetical protein
MTSLFASVPLQLFFSNWLLLLAWLACHYTSSFANRVHLDSCDDCFSGIFVFQWCHQAQRSIWLFGLLPFDFNQLFDNLRLLCHRNCVQAKEAPFAAREASRSRSNTATAAGGQEKEEVYEMSDMNSFRKVEMGSVPVTPPLENKNLSSVMGSGADSTGTPSSSSSMNVASPLLV